MKAREIDIFLAQSGDSLQNWKLNQDSYEIVCLLCQKTAYKKFGIENETKQRQRHLTNQARMDDLSGSQALHLDLSTLGNVTPRRKPKSGLKDTHSPMSAREKPGGSFRVQGHGYNLDIGREYAGAGAAGVYVGSRAAPEDNDDDTLTNPMIVEQLLGINKTLEKQIETLRLRLDFDLRHHEAQKVAIIADTGCQISSKNEEIRKLKDQLQTKDSKIQTLSEANEKKTSEISDLRQQLDSLTLDVESAKTYANDLTDELAILTEEKKKLESGGAFGDKDKQINELQKEIGDLKNNLTTLEVELKKAHDIMGSQTGKIKFLETDKKNIQLKFKEELAKVSHSMRLEVEKMRDVMKKQWEEMRSLREQNESMSRDIKDIRNLLISGTFDDDAKPQYDVHVPTQRNEFVRNFSENQLVQALPLPPPQANTSRGIKYQYPQGALKPSLPVLNKDAKKMTPTRKK